MNPTCFGRQQKKSSTILLVVGIPDAQVTELTGISARRIRAVRKQLRDGAFEDVLFSASEGGRERKLKCVEEFIAEQIESNDYHTHKEIADMVYWEHGI